VGAPSFCRIDHGRIHRTVLVNAATQKSLVLFHDTALLSGTVFEAVDGHTTFQFNRPLYKTRPTLWRRHATPIHLAAFPGGRFYVHYFLALLPSLFSDYDKLLETLLTPHYVWVIFTQKCTAADEHFAKEVVGLIENLLFHQQTREVLRTLESVNMLTAKDMPQAL